MRLLFIVAAVGISVNALADVRLPRNPFPLRHIALGV